MRFFRCRHCGNVVMYAVNSGVPVVCCGEEMQELVPGVTDASREKHVPAVTREGDFLRVQVGSVAHPMEENHRIDFVALKTARGIQVQSLKPGEAPSASFALVPGDAPESAWEYCSLHGLWKADV
ncbi:MAG TPA: desulfoferrodoxin family protein [Candidatus Limnocylindria bacterium]|nr:desulfoferrodoxin family protein [Candidatus Limnocylindria bacterium]